MRSALAVDLGGTNLRVAVVTEDGRLAARSAQPTPAAAGPDAVLDAIVRQVEDLAGEVGLPASAPLGLAIPGPVDARTGVVAFTPNLRDWRNYPLGDRLRERIGRP